MLLPKHLLFLLTVLIFFTSVVVGVAVANLLDPSVEDRYWLIFPIGAGTWIIYVLRATVIETLNEMNGVNHDP